MRTLMGIASRAGPKGRLSVLIFHRVAPEPDALFPQEMHARRFDEVCGWLKSWFNVLPLDQAVLQLKNGSLPARAACITFDDGYADNHEVAAPILRRHGLTATFFIATGFMDGGRMWNDTVIESIRLSKERSLDLGSTGRFPIDGPEQKVVAIDALIRQFKYLPVQERLAATERLNILAGVSLPSNLMMTSAQVKALRRSGMQIGAHTITHPILARLNDDEARAEIKGSKDALENLLSEPVNLFAYPNGKPGVDYSTASVAIAREAGFVAAVSTSWGVAGREVDAFQIPRFTPWNRTRFRFASRLLANYYR